MRSISRINAKPPVISRVCRKSRGVAFETGGLVDHPPSPDEAHLRLRFRKHWVDRVRGTVGPWVIEIDGRMVTYVLHERTGHRLVKEEVWEKTPAENTRYSLQRDWVPNQQHPWVKAAYSNMPKFIPTIMSRLCTNNYHGRN